MHPTFHSNSSSLASALGGMQPSRETQFALAPTNPSANSVHYPRAENYPTERAFSMPPVGVGAPALEHSSPAAQPTPPQNHPSSQFTLQNNRGRALDLRYQRALPQPHAGKDQHAPVAQYQSTYPAGVYPSAPNAPRLQSSYSFSHVQSVPQGGLPAAQLQVQRTHSLPVQSGHSTNPHIHHPTRQMRATAGSHPSLSTPNALRNTSSTPSQPPSQNPFNVSQLQRSIPAPNTSSRSLSRPSTFNHYPHQPVAANPTTGHSAQSTGPTFRPPAPPARQTGSVPVHPPHQFAAPPAPTPVQRTQSLPAQPPKIRPVAARAPVGPSPLQQSMTTPADLSFNPYAYMLSKPSQPAASNAQQVYVPRPPPQLRRSDTEPTTGKRRHDEEKVEEEKRQAKKAKVAPKVPQTKPLETIEEAGEVQETGIPHENGETVLPDSEQNEIVTETSSVEASSPPRCIDDYVVLRRYNLLLYAAGLHEPKLLHGDVLLGLPPQLAVHSIETAVIVRALGESDLGVGRLKALSPDEAKTTIVGWWGVLEDMKKDGIWPDGCPTYYPVPLDDKQVGGKGMRALSADDPSPVSSSMETTHDLSEDSDERMRRISQRMRRKRR
ncbi:hypothetical protein BDZ89DRAFT_1071640 [Hymenopellis radicata]|nr:hypothetical protein BDZ89DRAFT_1071640 [Hymenopellis radicata]